METEATPRPAATVVIVRPGSSGVEVLLQRRATNLAFMGGIWVFPGGRVDEADQSESPADAIATARSCAIREALEESGVDLNVAGPGGSAALLVPFARWVTPVIERRRYDTLFFVAGVGADTIAVEDGNEATETIWVKPADALERSRTGVIRLAPPTLLTLHDLLTLDEIDQIAAWARDRSLAPVEPVATLTETGPIIAFPGDPLFGPITETGRPTRCALIDGNWVLGCADR